jgi:hypothetical protein
MPEQNDRPPRREARAGLMDGFRAWLRRVLLISDGDAQIAAFRDSTNDRLRAIEDAIVRLDAKIDLLIAGRPR